MGWGKTLQFLRRECSTERYGTYYDPKWADAVKHRDNYRCQICNNINLKKHGIIVGKKKDRWIQAHHILYKSNYPDLKHSINNGITLCHWCHKETHLIDK